MFAGVDTLTLNNNKQDGSRVHQLVGYPFFRAAGLGISLQPCARERERQINRRLFQCRVARQALLPPHVQKAKGTLYEGTVCDFHLHSLVRFERKFGSKKAIHPSKMPAWRLGSDDRSILDKLGRHLDLDQFYPYWAAEVLVGHWDGYVRTRTTTSFISTRNRSDCISSRGAPISWRPIAICFGVKALIHPSLSRQMQLFHAGSIKIRRPRKNILPRCVRC
ncbi:MAG: hypothetical protein CM1200mP29_12560 [Verrucomicrobiota bacterium]|nr:MAG: hypothetical protein CM1200mP29_12560 [Verrucomicrobiota bacterium]